MTKFFSLKTEEEDKKLQECLAEFWNLAADNQDMLLGSLYTLYALADTSLEVKLGIVGQMQGLLALKAQKETKENLGYAEAVGIDKEEISRQYKAWTETRKPEMGS